MELLTTLHANAAPAYRRDPVAACAEAWLQVDAPAGVDELAWPGAASSAAQPRGPGTKE